MQVLEDHGRPGEAVGRTPIEIDDLAGEELSRPGFGEEVLPRAVLTCPRRLKELSDVGAEIPASVKTVISIWGNARRMPSQLTIGRPISAAVAIGSRVLTPPAALMTGTGPYSSSAWCATSFAM